MRRIVFLTLLCMLNTASLADTLTIATHEFTSNWHPIDNKTYPAKLLTGLTTEHFLVKACIGESSPNSRDNSQNTTIRQGITGKFLKMCLKPGTAVGSSSFLTIDATTLDRTKCSNVSAADIAFTLRHMRQDKTNDYQNYDLKMTSGILSINNPAYPPAETVRQALSFPIIRQGIADQIFGSYSQNAYNKITAGPYKVESFTVDRVQLKPRNPYIDSQVNMSQIDFKYFSVRQQLVQSLQTERVDVALNLPTSISVSPQTYKQNASSELNNVAYVGFNFATDNNKLKTLYRNRTFRKVFTQSIWANRVIRDKLDFIGTSNPDGIFYGEGFEDLSREDTTLWRYTDLPKKINSFVKRRNLNSEVKILINPSMNFIFNSTDLRVFFNALNKLWKGSLRFTAINPGTPATYARELQKGHFDMLMDTFFFGKNPYKPLYFLLENHETNLLQNNVIPAERIRQWLNEGVPGLEKFRRKMLRSYPITIIGSFMRRDYISTKIQINKHACPDHTIPIPYTFMPDWQHER